MALCPICRERHDADRGLSFDGQGINSCGEYRSRLAKFSDPQAAGLLGDKFAAAPTLYDAVNDAAEELNEFIESCDLYDDTTHELWPLVLKLRKARAIAEGKAEGDA